MKCDAEKQWDWQRSSARGPLNANGVQLMSASLSACQPRAGNWNWNWPRGNTEGDDALLPSEGIAMIDSYIGLSIVGEMAGMQRRGLRARIFLLLLMSPCGKSLAKKLERGAEVEVWSERPALDSGAQTTAVVTTPFTSSKPGQLSPQHYARCRCVPVPV